MGLVIGVLFLALAILILVIAWRLRKGSGLPTGRVVSSDVDAVVKGKPLYSARYGLAGTPDYLIETPRGPVPVEVKPTRTETEPHESHLLQVLAYCLLVEEAVGKRPPYGLLRYSTETFKVDYNRETRSYLISVIDEIRGAAMQTEMHRSHDTPGKCWGCLYKGVCEESLV